MSKMQKDIVKGVKMKKPNNTVEVFMSMLKWFTIILIFNNLAWIIATSNVKETTQITKLTQDGYGNNQEVTNG